MRAGALTISLPKSYSRFITVIQGIAGVLMLPGSLALPLLLTLVALFSLLSTACGTGSADVDASSGDLLGKVPDGYDKLVSWNVQEILQADGRDGIRSDFLDAWEWTEEFGIYVEDTTDLVDATDQDNRIMHLRREVRHRYLLQLYTQPLRYA